MRRSRAFTPGGYYGQPPPRPAPPEPRLENMEGYDLALAAAQSYGSNGNAVMDCNGLDHGTIHLWARVLNAWGCPAVYNPSANRIEIT